MKCILHENRNPGQEIWDEKIGKNAFKGNVKWTVGSTATA
jgi:hypothetical protein